MSTLISQPNKPQSNRLRLKLLQWIVPLVILSALVGGYFAYQNYVLQKTTREITAPAPATNQITKEQAIDLIAQNYPAVVEARGGTQLPDEFIEQLADGWQINFYWG